jgi:hypothetical protein
VRVERLVSFLSQKTIGITGKPAQKMEEIVEALKRVHPEENDAKEVADKACEGQVQRDCQAVVCSKIKKWSRNAVFTARFEIAAVLNVAKAAKSKPRVSTSPSSSLTARYDIFISHYKHHTGPTAAFPDQDFLETIP